MTDTFKAIALGTLLIPGAALANFEMGTPVGTDDAAITAFFTAEGYTIQQIEREEDEIEVTLLRDGIATEVELNAAGQIVEIELADTDEDDDDGDDDDSDDDDA